MIPLLVSSSCQTESEQIKINAVEGVWPKNESQKFEINIQDNENSKNVIFVVRNNNDYPYSNLRVFCKMYPIQKEKQITIDTLNYLLAHPDGTWIGSGFGTTKETLFQYKINYKFPKKGTYILELNHAMRRDTLVGIEDIGVIIEPTKS